MTAHAIEAIDSFDGWRISTRAGDKPVRVIRVGGKVAAARHVADELAELLVAAESATDVSVTWRPLE